jgi:hypothetical protein
MRASIGESTWPKLNIDDLVGMFAQVPARAIAEMRKKGMDAGVNLLGRGFVLNLAAFDVDSIHRSNGDLPELRAPCRNLKAQGTVVAHVE